MVDRCPGCGMRFSREEGFFIGALFVNFAVTEGLLFVWLAATFLATAPAPRSGRWPDTRCSPT